MEFAKSLAGHDRNHVYLIWKKEERFVYLVNGTTHTIEHPKRKNEKHYQIIKNIPENIFKMLQESEPLTDDRIRQAVKAYERSINK